MVLPHTQEPCRPLCDLLRRAFVAHVCSVGLSCVQLQRCLPWLNPRAPESSESRRYAAVLMLRRLAEAQPAVFNVHVKQFIDSIWGALRDPKVSWLQAGQ